MHNRVSIRIHLKPFCLRECELYSEEMGLRFNRRQVLEGYMIMGGVPFYWSQLKPGMSLAQNINQLFSQKMAIFVTSLMTYTTLCSNSLSLISR